MITINTPIELYTINELPTEARAKAIQEQQIFLDSEPIEHEAENGEMLKTYHEHTEAEAVESIEANAYYYFFSGEMADVTTYTGKHHLTGHSVFTFLNKKVFI